MVAFQGGAGSGSMYGGDDRDYDDFVVIVESVIGAPEADSLMLFGFALLMGGVMVRRRRAVA